MKRDIPDPVGAVMAFMNQDKSIEPGLARQYRQIKRDDIDEFDVPDDDEGSWSESYWRERL